MARTPAERLFDSRTDPADTISEIQPALPQPASSHHANRCSSLALLIALALLGTPTRKPADQPIPHEGRREGDDRARGLQGHALRGRAGRRAADRVHLRRPRPDVGGRVPAATRTGRRTARATTASSSSKTPTATASSTRGPSSSTTASNLSGIELGFGGVWLCSSPNLRLRPDPRRTTSRGPPEVVLDGWNIKDTKHNIFNSLGWGPDGWLYGCNGIQAKAWVGKPGTPKDQRPYIDCGVWRYHPTRKVVRGGRPRHDQPVRPGLGRVRRDVHHELRDRPPVPLRPRRALRAHVRPGREPARLRPDEELRRLQALGRRRLDRARATTGVGGKPEHSRRRRRPRPQRLRDLPRRQLPGGVPQHALHLQHPRQPAEPRRPRTHADRLRRACAGRTSCSPTTRGSAASA